MSSQEGCLPRAGKGADSPARRGQSTGGRWRKAAIGAAGSELLKRHTAPPAWRPGSRDPGETPGQAGPLGPVGPCPLCVTCHRPHGGSPGWTAPGTHQGAAESEPGARRQPHGQPGCAQRPARPPYPPSERVGHHPSRQWSRHVCQDGGNEGAHVGASRSGRVRSAVWGPRSLFPWVVGEGLGQVLLPPPAVAPMCLSGSKRPPFLL